MKRHIVAGVFLIMSVLWVNSFAQGTKQKGGTKPMSKPSPQADFDVAEIRAAERLLVQALEAPDPIGRVYMYTDDATFVAPGAPAVQGRDALLERAKVATPISSFVLTPLETEGHGNLAYVYGYFSWVNGPAATTDGKRSSMRFLIVWRKETDGHWRIAREMLNNDAAPK